MLSTATWWPADWTVLHDEEARAAHNMARDLALAQSAFADARALLRTYRWHRPTVSFGRNEAVRESWDVEAMLAAGFEVVRRPTGGRALLHAREITWSVTLPVPDHEPWRAVYDAVNERLSRALRSLGAPVSLFGAERQAAEAEPGQFESPRGDATALRDGTSCFAEPSVGELVIGHAKIAGSAVWRTERGYLQHGSILLDNDQALLAQFARRPVPAARVSTLREWLSGDAAELHAARMSDAVSSALASAFEVLPVSTSRADDTPAYQHAFHAALPQFDSREWLWRR